MRLWNIRTVPVYELQKDEDYIVYSDGLLRHRIHGTWHFVDQDALVEALAVIHQPKPCTPDYYGDW